MLSQKRLKRHVHYNPENGLFTRILDHRGRIVSIPLFPVPHSAGYLRMRIEGKMYFLHRLAIRYMTGDLPNVVDHLNGDRADNSWTNLSNGTQRENMRNKEYNRAGTGGVHFNRTRRRWIATFTKDGKKKHLGSFHTESAARAARLRAEERDKEAVV